MAEITCHLHQYDGSIVVIQNPARQTLFFNGTRGECWGRECCLERGGLGPDPCVLKEDRAESVDSWVLTEHGARGLDSWSCGQEGLNRSGSPRE